MSESLLKARALRKSFPGAEGDIHVLDGLDFDLAPGESVSVRGESGSGKSTFLNVISGLETADEGRLEWSGRDVAGRGAAALARLRTDLIGFVFQSYYLSPELNAVENVLLGARIRGRVDGAARDRAAELLDRVGLSHRLRHASTKLSGGERQRVAVARALINRPRAILADEPTGNLDEHTAGSVMDLLLRLVAEESAALVLVTHNPEFAARTDRRLLLHNGRLEDAGARDPA